MRSSYRSRTVGVGCMRKPSRRALSSDLSRSVA